MESFPENYLRLKLININTDDMPLSYDSSGTANPISLDLKEGNSTVGYWRKKTDNSNDFNCRLAHEALQAGKTHDS